MNKNDNNFEEKIKDFLLQQNIDYSDLKFYKIAFTLANYVNENSNQSLESNERLEFLGDAILQLMVSQYIFQEFDKISEGPMTLMRAKVVNKNSLAKKSKELNLSKIARTGNGNKNLDSLSEKTLSDLLEAFVGALYLDTNFDTTFFFIKKHICSNIKENDDLKDYKTKLQELMQSEHGKSVEYVKIKEANNSNNQMFEIRVEFDNQRLAVGKGNSIKSAEQDAAKKALELLSK